MTGLGLPDGIPSPSSHFTLPCAFFVGSTRGALGRDGDAPLFLCDELFALEEEVGSRFRFGEDLGDD